MKNLLKNMSKKIKADHYDEEQGSQIVEGCYGYSALMAMGPNVYEPPVDGSFSASYGNCRLTENAKTLRIHGIAREDATIKVFVDEALAGEFTLNTRTYDRKAGPARNHMPRAVEDEIRRKNSYPLLWADVHIPLKLDQIQDFSYEQGHLIRLEVQGPFCYDWFMILA